MLSSLPQVKDGISVNAYGQGQLAGATFTAPAHSTTDIDIKLQIMCVTPQNIENLEKLILSMLNASQQESFKQHSVSTSSGGSAFFGIFSHSNHSTTTTTDVLNTLGLTVEQQSKIIDQMLTITNKMNTFNLKSTIPNEEYDYSVSGSLFGIVMDATIQKGENHTQVRFLAPKTHLKSSTGETLPVVGKLY